MGLILILLLTLHDRNFIERMQDNKKLKILVHIVIAMYYIGILATAVKIGLSR